MKLLPYTHPINKDLQDLLKDKTIAYICPSKHLQGTGFGKKIDSCDLVIRVNQYFKMPERVKKDYGERMDILVTNMNRFGIIKFNDNYEWLCNTLKYIIVAMEQTDYSLEGAKTLLNKSNTPPYYYVHGEHIKEIRADIGILLHTGIFGLSFLLQCNIKSIFIGGISFYNMGKYGDFYLPEYKEEQKKYGILSPIDMDDKYVPFDKTRDELHSCKKEIEYFKLLLEKYGGTIELDDYLTKHFR